MPIDQVDLTAEALAALSLGRHTPHSSAGPRHDWATLTEEDNSDFSSALVATYVGQPGAFGQASSATKLLFYQSLVFGFGLRAAPDMPRSITQCKLLLRTIHLNIVDFLAAVRNNQPLTSIRTFNSKTQLRTAMLKERKFCTLGRAKREMLDPFLIVVRYY